MGQLPLVLPQVANKSKKRLKHLFRRKATRRRAVTIGIFSSNFLILVAISAFVILNPHHSVADSSVLPAAGSDQAAANPLDQVSSANIAETVAHLSNLPETTAVTNQADSENIEIAAPAASGSVADKPQLPTASGFASNKDINSYTSVAGDTITSIATKFGVTSDSIRWSNNLSGDAVAAGTKLQIPPVTGIVYTVQAGDTPTTLAAKYKADQGKIIAYNDAEISGLKVGSTILIPDGTKAAAIASSTKVTASSFSGGAAYGGYNGYDFGYCTYWVAKLRAASGNPVPTNLGNAATWATRAAAMGLPTGTTPRVGAAVVTKTAGAGHVAYVTAVNDDGTITISEMNHAGWNKTDSRDIPAGGYRYVY